MPSFERDLFAQLDLIQLLTWIRDGRGRDVTAAPAPVAPSTTRMTPAIMVTR